MPPKQLPLAPSTSSTTIQPHLGLASYPLEKYSYAVTNASQSSFNSSQFNWTHYTQRDNLYFVIDTGSSSPMPGASSGTYLKVIWNAQVLEYVDLGALLNVKLPVTDALCLPQPALLALGRCPMLAMRYPESQTMRRFQMRFAHESDFAAAKAMLESRGLKINNAIPAAQAQQAPIRPPSQFQGLNVYQEKASHALSMGSQITTPEVSVGNHISSTGSSNESQIHGPGSSIGTQAVVPEISFPMMFSYVPPEPLPPPRPLPEFLRQKITKPAASASKETPSSLRSIEQFTPPATVQPMEVKSTAAKKKPAPRAKKPTPPKVAPKSIEKNKPINSITPISSKLGNDKTLTSVVIEDITSSDANSSDELLLANPSLLKPKPSGSEAASGTGRSSSPALPPINFPQKLSKRISLENPPASIKAPSSSTKSSSSKGKGPATSSSSSISSNFKDCSYQIPSSDQRTDSDPVQGGQNILITDNNEEVEALRFHALENLIVDKIHDEEFCKLLAQVGRVWQRMGFERVFRGDGSAGAGGGKGGGLFDIGL